MTKPNFKIGDLVYYKDGIKLQDGGHTSNFIFMITDIKPGKFYPDVLRYTLFSFEAEKYITPDYFETDFLILCAS